MHHTLKKKKPTSAKKNHSVRIIGGKWRRRALPVVEADGLRPTGDRVRETLFNWLAPHIDGARALDAFAGTGVLGLEALSRGAAFVQFVEYNPNVAKQLSSNLSSLNLSPEEYRLACNDTIQWLDRYEGPPFDLVFLDPPFDQAFWSRCCSQLDREGRLTNNALIYVETPLETKLNVPPEWHHFRQLKAGQIIAHLFKLEQP